MASTLRRSPLLALCPQARAPLFSNGNLAAISRSAKSTAACIANRLTFQSPLPVGVAWDIPAGTERSCEYKRSPASRLWDLRYIRMGIEAYTPALVGLDIEHGKKRTAERDDRGALASGGQAEAHADRWKVAGSGIPARPSSARPGNGRVAGEGQWTGSKPPGVNDFCCTSRAHRTRRRGIRHLPPSKGAP
jgi:hypothetical protein